MKYGLIGKNVEGSYSKLIHNFATGCDYKLMSLTDNQVMELLDNKSFDGINVTMPYKETVLSKLDYIDDVAKEIGAVNTIVNENRLLKGYNTDYLGFIDALKSNHISLANKDIIILGSGGACKAIKYASLKQGAKRIRICSRSDDFDLNYESLVGDNDVQVIINTTPLGQYNYPNHSFDLRSFKNLECVCDLVYRPNNTMLIRDAKTLHLKTMSGLDMLIYQALHADKLFGLQIKKKFSQIKEEILKEKSNIVLVGMMCSGKSTIGHGLGMTLGIPVIDIDDYISSALNNSIESFIEKNGEEAFRDVENRMILKHGFEKESIIVLGGGAIIHTDALDMLKENSLIIFIKRDLKDMYESAMDEERPLAKDYSSFKKLYKKRLPLYKKYSDIIIENKNINSTVLEIIEKTKNYHIY